jgi:1,4-dihydroxy-2-naphthoyl-CoA hydrolase
MAALYDIEILATSDEEVRARIPVGDHLRQPLGLVHGGAFAAIADTLAVGATADALESGGARAISNQTSFLRPITAGAIHAVARRRHRGRTTWVWEVDVSDDAGRLCALVRITVAVRP